MTSSTTPVQQVFPPVDVVMQGHAFDAEVGAEPPHGQVPQAVLLDQGDRREQDGPTVQRATSAGIDRS